LRPSEAVDLQAHTIHLDAPIPYVEVLPDGRVPKTEDSRCQVPIVGAALAAMKRRPQGFPSYRDKSGSLSTLVNKYFVNHGLRPTEEHTLYSLRHSFKDRLIAAEAPDSLIDSLMGHRTGKPKYGKGPPLELKLKFLDSIAFTPPRGCKPGANGGREGRQIMGTRTARRSGPVKAVEPPVRPPPLRSQV
jgi:hypothetical protein